MKIEDIVQKVRRSIVRVVSESGSGTGIVIDDRGIVLTDCHVVGSDGAPILVSFDGKVHIGKVLYSDSYRDIALMYSRPKRFLAAKLDYSRKVKIGEEIITIGHPEGLPYSVTKGIVSYPSRLWKEKPGLPYIQYDAPSHPGSSGGALLDLQGKVVGIVCLGWGESLNLAIPVTEIKAKVLDIKKRLIWYQSSKHCSVCGEANGRERRYCGRCGTRLMRDYELQRLVKAKSVEVESLVICTKCKSPNFLKDPENIYCGVCFSPLFPSSGKKYRKIEKSGQVKIICPICKKKNAAGLKYCTTCGKELMARGGINDDAQ